VTRRLAAILLLAAVSACGGGGGGGGVGSLPPTEKTTPTPTPAAAVDDWTTYAHDTARTGFETQATGITSTTVSSLTLTWRITPNPNCATQAESDAVIADQASPLVANGFVYYADSCGYIAALSTTTGSVTWKRQLNVPALGGPLGTPTLDAANNLLIVPVHGSAGSGCTQTPPCANPAKGGYLAALNAQTGALVWEQTPLSAGNLRGEPIVVNGVVYEGLAGGDFFSGATNGGIFALNESTGAVIGSIPLVQAAPPGATYDGGGSWSPISYDGTYLYFGFGNTLNNNGLQDSVVRFDLQTEQLTQNFDLTTFDGKSDDEDVGGGEMLYGGNLYFEGKNGRYYAYALDNPSVPIADSLVNTNSQAGSGAIWTPTTDGNVVAVSSGYNTKTPQFSSILHIFSIGGDADRCDSIQATNSALYSYAAFVSGVGFTGLDNDVPNGTPDGGANGPAPAFVAFDDTCNILWKAAASDILSYFYAGPAVVPSGVYAIDDMGNVYAWKLPSAAAASRSTALTTRNVRALIRPGVRSTIRFTQYARRRAQP